MQTTHRFGAKTVTRRSFLKQSALGGAAVIAAPYVISPARAAETELTMLAWYGHAEPDIVADFEAQHNVKVKPKYYTGGDNMLALIAQSPPGTYDLILSDAEYVQQLNAAGYIEQLDPKDYPLDDYFPEFQKFPGHWQGDKLFSVMARFGFLGVAYNTEAVSEKAAKSYKVYWDPAYEGKLGHFDWHLPNLGEMSLYSGNTAPFDLNEAAWEKVQETTLSLRPQVGGFFDYGGTFSSLKSGQMALFCGIGDWITGVLQKEGAKVNGWCPTRVVCSGPSRSPSARAPNTKISRSSSFSTSLPPRARSSPLTWLPIRHSFPTRRAGSSWTRNTPRKPSARAWCWVSPT